MMRCQSSRAPQATRPLATAVDPAPPAPINSEPKGREEKKGRNDRKQGGKLRERETDNVERETTEIVETKNQGYRQGDRERQTGRRKKKDRIGKPAGEEETDWCL